MYNYVSCTELIELISRNTPNLTALNVTLTDKILEAHRFECIVENIPNLEFLALGDSDVIMYDLLDEERWERRTLFDDFISTFLKWRKLKELEFVMCAFANDGRIPYLVLTAEIARNIMLAK